jgi:AraC-like DNA-binding protein
MEFVKTKLREELAVNSLITLHYFEFSKNYVFQGEKHDFWEFLYVDRGEVEVMADTRGYKLKQGDIIFHQPNEFHSVWANRKIAPNSIVVCFDSSSPGMSFFRKKIFSLGAQEKELLAQIVKHGTSVFLPPFDDPMINRLIRRELVPPGAEQMVKLHLELLLLGIYLREDSPQQEQRLYAAVKERSENDLVKRMVAFMERELSRNATLEQICRHINLSKSQATTLFRRKTGHSIMKFYKQRVIDEAKKMIREENYNFSQIAELLNYSSVHSFSRHFKSTVGMSPSEYAKTVKAMIG